MDDAVQLAALYDLTIAAEAFRCEPESAVLGVALVHALERYNPAPSDPSCDLFSIARESLIRDLIDRFPEAFPWPMVNR